MLFQSCHLVGKGGSTVCLDLVAQGVQSAQEDVVEVDLGAVVGDSLFPHLSLLVNVSLLPPFPSGLVESRYE